MGYVVSFLLVAFFTTLVLIFIMSFGFTRKLAGFGNLAPSGPAAFVAAKVSPAS